MSPSSALRLRLIGRRNARPPESPELWRPWHDILGPRTPRDRGLGHEVALGLDLGDEAIVGKLHAEDPLWPDCKIATSRRGAKVDCELCCRRSRVERRSAEPAPLAHVT
jgi:hypothetical protein